MFRPGNACIPEFIFNPGLKSSTICLKLYYVIHSATESIESLDLNVIISYIQNISYLKNYAIEIFEIILENCNKDI